MPPPTLLKPQTQIFSLFPNSPFSLSNPNSPFSTTQTVTFLRKPTSLSLSLSLSTNSFSHNTQNQYPEEEEEEEEDHVIGDCVVFEEGIFEDPYLRDDFDFDKPSKKNSTSSIKPEVLVPDKWKEVQAEINITKKERRKIAHNIEFGSRIEKKNRGVPLTNTVEFLSYREHKLSQLNPVVLDNPSYDLKEEVMSEGEGEVGCSTSTRVAPRNPRLAVYQGTLDDISEFFHSGDYVPGENTDKKSDVGPRKLFTKEEKVLMNKRIPNLEDATSDKWLPLHTLAASGEFYLVDALLKHNVDINAVDKDGLTALHKAILSKKQAVTNYLLRESANPFVRDKEGATLMHYAVQTASSHTIKILLLYNVDINLADDDGWTPLHLAVQARRTDLVRLLLIKGADKTLKNQDGLTPLDMCLYSGRDTRTYELIKLLKQLPKPKRQI
ncbi:Ankyrin repeat [Macleaya cordata]|uniref:Ankyrin repeat n=1 Tax=Macleaya cordata TaxID=56857 RepID=A0A200QEF9_MACCD|nr:Ankyrin repeat [Macleaya cordata]